MIFLQERADQLLNERLPTPDTQPSPEDERAAFLQAAGGVRPDGRVYGLGSQSALVYPDEIRIPRVMLRATNDEL